MFLNLINHEDTSGDANSIFEMAATVEFELGAKRKDVLKKVNEVFDRIDKMKVAMGRKKRPLPKLKLLRDALRVYKAVTYEKKTRRQLALKEMTYAETYSAAYNRIKKRLQAAERLIEGGGFKEI